MVFKCAQSECVVLRLLRSDRKILDRDLRTFRTLSAIVATVLERMSFLLRSGAACSRISWKCDELVQVQDVAAWISCWILRLWPEHCTTDSRIAPVFVAAEFCCFSVAPLAMRSQLSIVP